MLLGYGAKVGLGNMRVKAENRMVTTVKGSDQIDCLVTCIGTLKSGTAAALYDQNGTSIGAVGQSNFSASSSPKTFVWRTGGENGAYPPT